MVIFISKFVLLFFFFFECRICDTICKIPDLFFDIWSHYQYKKYCSWQSS